MEEKNIISYLGLEDGFFGEQAGSAFVWDASNSVTAEEFYRQAEAFAAFLEQKGYWNQPVAVRARHRLETLELYLGVLLSGNYYVPVAEDLTPQKEQKILQSAGVQAVYDPDDLSGILIDGEGAEEQITEDGLRERLRRARERLSEDAPLYLIYTSGSTGEPKGILKSHRNMIAFLESYLEEFDFTGEDVLANQTPFCFDASAKDFYLMLKKRLPMYIVDAAMFLRPGELVHRLNTYRISVIQWVPSALSMLSQLKAFEKERPEYLRRVSFVGEAFPVRQLRYWQQKLPRTEFVNLYGASELAGVCCYYRVPEDIQGEALPLGRPLPHQRIYLVEQRERIDRPGVQGEICIESECLADGYLDADALRHEAFVSCLTEEIRGGRYYRTGDRGEYDKEGNLWFAGRADDQIKHMGHRIELGELEQAALRLEQVEAAAAVYCGGRITLFCAGKINRAELKRYLRQNLSDYMFPQRVELMDRIPLNRHGKVDRPALRQYAEGRKD